jgi:uncharacterized protein YjbI with pentapeptide repeats
MSVDEPTGPIGGEAGDRLSTTAGRISDGVVLCGESFSGETFRLASARRGYFTDCLFRNCIFDQCDFQRCDFEAVVFESCTFIKCDFSSADLRSVEFSRCSIADARFPNGAIKACTFVVCELTRCRFYRQSFEENRLSDCLLDSCRFHRATMLHIEFRRCHFQQSSIADCTSLYHFFLDCSFEQSEINVDSVPLSFGLTRENLTSLKLVWQGKKVAKKKNVDELLDDLFGSVGTRGWSIPAAMLALNFALTPTRNAMDLAFAGISEAVQARRPLRSDEIKFTARVVAILVSRNAMPFLPVMKGIDLIIDLAQVTQESQEEVLRPLFHALRSAEQVILRSWENTWRSLQSLGSGTVTVEFVFEENPHAPLRPVLQELQQVLGDRGPSPKHLGTRMGSYIEMLSIPVSTLFALMVSMGMLVRILDLMLIARLKGRWLVAQEVPDAIYQRALAEPPSPSSALLGTLRLLGTGLTDGQAPVTSSSADAIADKLSGIRVLDDTDVAPSVP